MHSSQNDRVSDTVTPLDSGKAFAGKLLVGTFGGAAVVKYGSLLLPIPFEPSLGVAAFMIIFPVIYFTLFFWQKSSQ
jgi:hypothetical protein